MKVWISTVGWSSFAVINPLWAACFLEEEKFIPDKVILLNNQDQDEIVKKNYPIVESWLKTILIEYGIENPIINSVEANENSMKEYFETFKKVYEEHEKDNVAIDMTPGRKFMSGIAMWLASQPNSNIEKLYYLQLWGQEYQNLPFIKIPLIKQKLINVKGLMRKDD